MQQLFNPKLEIEGILLTMVNIGTTFNEEVMKELQKYFSEKVYKNHIPRNVTLSEAASYDKNIFSYQPKCAGATCAILAYQHLINEVLMSNDKKI